MGKRSWLELFRAINPENTIMPTTKEERETGPSLCRDGPVIGRRRRPVAERAFSLMGSGGRQLFVALQPGAAVLIDMAEVVAWVCPLQKCRHESEIE
jgi:hypothetical protein